MLSLLTPILLAVALAACGSDTEPASASSAAPQGQVVANDCRSPDAQTTQRGCRPITRAVATQ